MTAALVIFLITCLFIGLRQIPRVHIDRPAGALVGAVLMVVCGVMTLDQAFAAIDLHTLLLLLGMMIITVYLRAGASITIIIGIVVLALGAGTAHGAERISAEPSAAQLPTMITVHPGEAADRNLTIVLLCADNATRVRGLQGFRRLRSGEAALFVFDPATPVTFWMGSVAYPIDMIFVDATGRVTGVHQDRRPGDRAVYTSPGSVRWVIETAARSGIRSGDRVEVR